ncbi:MAG: MFS transporter [Frankiaceae bacterium]
MPASANGHRLLVTALIDSLGSGTFMAASVILFTTQLGITAAQIGLGLTVAGLAGLVCVVPWGIVADRAGPRRVVFVLLCWRAVGYSCYAFVHHVTGYLIVTLLVGVAEKANSPLTLAVASQAVSEEERLPLVAYIRSVRNVGITGGALLATVAMLAADRAALLAVVFGNAATFVVAAVLLLRLDLAPVQRRPRRERRPRSESVLRRPAYCASAALAGILSIHRALLSVGLPLWVIGHTSAPRSVVTLLIALNAALVMALQVRLSRNAAEPILAGRAMRRAGGSLVAFAGLIYWSGQTNGPLTIAVLVGALLALTLGELWHSAGSWGISLTLAPPASRARFLTAFNLGLNVLDVCGALVITSWVLPAGRIGWLGLALVVTAAGIAMVPVAAWARREADRATVPTYAVPVVKGGAGPGTAAPVATEA